MIKDLVAASPTLHSQPVCPANLNRVHGASPLFLLLQGRVLYNRSDVTALYIPPPLLPNPTPLESALKLAFLVDAPAHATLLLRLLRLFFLCDRLASLCFLRLARLNLRLELLFYILLLLVLYALVLYAYYYYYYQSSLRQKII